VLAAVTPTISGLLSPVFGRLADRFGRKMMLIRSLAGFTVIIAVMGLVTSVQQLLVTRILMGFFAGFTPMAMALATVSAPRDKVSVAIARVQGAQLLSVAVGPLVGGVVASHAGTRAAFYATAVMCAIALIALIFLFQEARPLEPGEARRTSGRMPLRDFVRLPYFIVVFVLLVIAQFVDRGLALLIPLHVAHMPGIEAIAATSGLIISIGAVGAAVSASLVPRLAQLVPVGRLLFLQFALGGLFCGAMALAHHWIVLLVLRTIVALCLGGALTLAYSLGSSIVPADTRSSAFGWLAMGVGLGTAVSPLATGVLAAITIPGAFLVNAVLAWIAGAVLFFSARDLLRRGKSGGGLPA
jgi:DHA1 family multidrug resistance protein-like MFS transporter